MKLQSLSARKNKIFNVRVKAKHIAVIRKILYLVKNNLTQDENGDYKESFIDWELSLTPNEYKWLNDCVEAFKIEQDV